VPNPIIAGQIVRHFTGEVGITTTDTNEFGYCEAMFPGNRYAIPCLATELQVEVGQLAVLPTKASEVPDGKRMYRIKNGNMETHELASSPEEARRQAELAGFPDTYETVVTEA
jgi:hypothetical protein